MSINSRSLAIKCERCEEATSQLWSGCLDQDVGKSSASSPEGQTVSDFGGHSSQSNWSESFRRMTQNPSVNFRNNLFALARTQALMDETEEILRFTSLDGQEKAIAKYKDPYGLGPSAQQYVFLDPPASALQVIGMRQSALSDRCADANDMTLRCKFGKLGHGQGLFNSPHGFCLNRGVAIVVADTNNHLIKVFTLEGAFIHEFGERGIQEGKLWFPRKVCLMGASLNFAVCDRGGERSRLQLFDPAGRFVRHISIPYINIVAGLEVSTDGSNIIIVDSVTPTVFIISEMGALVTYHVCLDFMDEPSDVAVRSWELFVCDFKGHKVVILDENTGQLKRKIGNPQLTPFPNGIDISDDGDVLIGDSHGNQFHVAVFDRHGTFLGQYTCPNVKVSRCCGLKITPMGYIVTLAKNNHHVLVLNTLYVE